MTVSSPSLIKLTCTVGALGAAAALAAGCSSSSAHPAASATGSPAISTAADSTSSAPACTAALLPSGFRSDSAHSGPVTATTYSQSADVQAALEYDGLQSGSRQVFLHRRAGRIDAVATCVTLAFPSADAAQRFFGSYRTLRRDAGRLAIRESLGRSVPGLQGVVAYVERDQSFRGYRIPSTTVLEAAGLHGTRLDIATISGSPATKPSVARLLSGLAGGAR